jgi:DNA-binding response OmpR family regulator
MAKTVLVVEDDPDISHLVRLTLEREHFQVRTTADGAAGYELATREIPALIILDVMLPTVDGLELCRRFREGARTASVPILILSAKTDEVDRVLGLELGADDYVTKPFSPRELLARVKALLRRQDRQAESQEVLRSGPVEIDTAKHEVISDGRTVQLSAKEFGLLVHLIKGHGRVFSRDQLLDQVWGYDYVGGTRTVDVHIRHLREKIPEIADRIMTVKSVGYKYTETPEP